MEAHILDFDRNIYGEQLEVEMRFHIRGMLAFTSVDDLVAAIRNDIAQRRDRTAALAPFA